MEAKAKLRIDLAKASEEITSLTQRKAQLEKSLKELPTQTIQRRNEYTANAEAVFKQTLDRKREIIDEVIEKKRREASDLLDTFPGEETKEIAGKLEIQTLEDHLMSVYPAEMIVDYICLNPIPISSDADAFRIYSRVEKRVAGLKNSSLSAFIFNSLMSLLDKAADIPAVGAKAGAGFFLLVVALLVFSPFLLLTLLSLLGFVGMAQGMFVGKLLRDLFSVKQYLNDSYDEDIFAKDKGDLMESVDSYMDDVRKDYNNVLDSQVFQPDKEALARIDREGEALLKKCQSEIDLTNQNISLKEDEMSALLAQLDKLEAEAKLQAEKAREVFLGTISWEKKWVDNIFLETASDNRIKTLPFSRANTVFYSKDIEPLHQLARLVIFQSMLKMHPDFACTSVLDYKYNGGELVQFSTLPARMLKLKYTEDELSKEEEYISNTIKARNSNILGTCPSIEEYNQLLAKYDAPGEYYIIVHVFGKTNFTQTFVNNVRNGNRVGFFFKFYCTLPELAEMKEDFPIKEISDYYEVGDLPLPRSLRIFKQAIGLE